MLVHNYLAYNSKVFPHKVAFKSKSGQLTYAQVDAWTDTLAAYLIQHGVRKGERVALLLDNSIEYLCAFFAILKTGAAVVPLNTQMKDRELSVILSDCLPKLLITGLAHQEVLKDLDRESFTVFIDGFDFTKNYGLSAIDDKSSEQDLAMIIYTSGTTGIPKGVMLSHENLDANADSIIDYLHLSPSDSSMVILPFYYSYGTSLITTHMKSGASLVIDNSFIYPNVILDAMEVEGVTGLAGVAAHFTILLRNSGLRKYALKKLRYVTQAGDAMAPSMIREFVDILPHVKFYVMYGQTEAAARLTYLDPAFLNKKIGSIGKPIPGVEIDLLDEQGRQVHCGKIGEIVARGKNIMKGYWNAKKETDKVIKKEGLMTGDLARKDQDGFIYLVSRRKEMIKSGANKISPIEIEQVVNRMQGVLECAAVGVPDEILGEAVKLCVVKVKVDVSFNDIMLFCKKNLASYMQPKQIKFFSVLPKTFSGKIKRSALLAS